MSEADRASLMVDGWIDRRERLYLGCACRVRTNGDFLTFPLEFRKNDGLHETTDYMVR
jgi:hypothetical protein